MSVFHFSEVDDEPLARNPSCHCIGNDAGGGICRRASPSTEQTKAVETLVTKAAAFIEKEGQTAAFAEFRKKDSEWLHGGTYLYAYDLKGNVILNAAFPQREGTNIVRQKDTKGKPFQDLILQIATTEGSGGSAICFLSPEQTEFSEKWAYVKKVTFDGRRA